MAVPPAMAASAPEGMLPSGTLSFVTSELLAVQAHKSHAAHVTHLAHLRREAAERQTQSSPRPYVGRHRTPVASTSPSAVYRPAGGGFQACVISRESGGDPQVMNSSMHYGWYQFDFSTWVSGGGNPADFGHASTGEQNAVFQSVYAARGTEPWMSDGC
jgi:hypothetical protein